MSSNINYETDARSVFYALGRISNDFALKQTSLAYWHQNFSSEPIKPIPFAGALQAHIGLSPSDKTAFVVALSSALTRSLDELPPVPDSMFSGSTNPSVINPDQGSEENFSEPGSAHVIVTTQFIKNLVLKIKKINPEDLMELSEAIEDTPGDLDRKEHSSLVNWSKSGFSGSPLEETSDEALCKKFSHHLYLLTCEILGPSDADDIFSSIAALLANSLPESDAFSPQKLL